jgi:hypothetical protein
MQFALSPKGPAKPAAAAAASPGYQIEVPKKLRTAATASSRTAVDRILCTIKIFNLFYLDISCFFLNRVLPNVVSLLLARDFFTRFFVGR